MDNMTFETNINYLQLEDANMDTPKTTGYVQERTLLGIVFECITVVVHMLTVGLTIFLIYLCFLADSFNLTTWHVLLYTIGWFLLATEGILFIMKDNILSKRISPRWRFHGHWIIITLGIALTIAGFVTIFVQKTNHFNSVHGITGLVSGILACIACLNGIPALFSVKLRKKIPPTWSKLCHAFFGSAAVILGVVALITSFYKNWFVRKTSDAAVVICFIITVIITCWTLLRPAFNMFSRTKSLFN